ncbi:MAG: XTP/dITP diphosphatase [Peptococcia bacterium]
MNSKRHILLIASRNQGKAQEVADLLNELSLSIQILTMADFPHLAEVEETGSTFEENAALKAVYAAKETGLITLGDDSGLEVDSLNGQPGVYSSRFAGEPTDDQRNNSKLLTMLQGVPPEERTARFVCALALAVPQDSGLPEIFYATGYCEGVILEEQRGDGGFGYDPLFYVPQLQKTFAQLNPEEKNLLSHRGKAMQKMAKKLCQIMGKPQS